MDQLSEEKVISEEFLRIKSQDKNQKSQIKMNSLLNMVLKFKKFKETT